LNGYTLLVRERIFIKPKLSLCGNPLSKIDTVSIEIDPPVMLGRMTKLPMPMWASWQELVTILGVKAVSSRVSKKLMEKPRRRKQQLPPFFDNIDNPELHNFPHGVEVDITPPPPQLSTFDRAVLQVCGDLGDRAHAIDFKALFRAYPEVFHQIKIAVDGEIFPGRNTEPEFLEDLTEIWFKRHGFEHIFCGNIHNGQLKGMHYAGRYLQLQEQGLAGRLPNNQQLEETIEGAVYTIGVLLKYRNQLIVDRRNGYALVADATELLIAATVAFKTKSRSRSACTFPVMDVNSGHNYPAVLVKKDRAIVTFYPDATPTDPHC
jgi:Bacterial EndoU nuclease